LAAGKPERKSLSARTLKDKPGGGEGCTEVQFQTSAATKMRGQTIYIRGGKGVIQSHFTMVKEPSRENDED